VLPPQLQYALYNIEAPPDATSGMVPDLLITLDSGNTASRSSFASQKERRPRLCCRVALQYRTILRHDSAPEPFHQWTSACYKMNRQPWHLQIRLLARVLC